MVSVNKQFCGLITRCKDEYFIKEFCEYYLSQQVNHIYIIDDDSKDKDIYLNLKSNPKITILFEKNVIQTDYANTLYKKIRQNYIWMIYVDVDEFITTKRYKYKTICDELSTTFKNAYCIIVPWVMMSSNNIEKNPNSILKTNIYRMNHDKKHPYVPPPSKSSNNCFFSKVLMQMDKYHKFRCRYNQIETKSIFKTEYFNNISDHYPLEIFKYKNKIYDSVYNKQTNNYWCYNNLRETDIDNGYLLCYHYRVISKENTRNKIKNNIWYRKYTLEEILASDYNEIADNCMIKKLK